MAKNPLDEIIEDLVVFKHAQGEGEEKYFSNDPRWQDSRIRKHWMNNKSDEAVQSAADTEPEDDSEDEPDTDYENWTNDELRAELSTRQLSLDGKKADLVERLRKDDAGEEV